ncbi:MAG TPA: chorismate synthase [Saprospiraceae bacterium]|nr:chorismate synthase [Saprospiraceae bacterium]
MNHFGVLFRISIYGESHGESLGIVMDGVPPGMPVSVEDFAEDLQRRKPGRTGTTQRREEDLPHLMSGVFKGYTTGAPLHIQFQNKDARSRDYDQQLAFPRPGHADYVANKKYKGFQDYRGGGHFSGRMTLALVAAGVVAKKILGPVRIQARVSEAGGTQQIDEAVAKAVESGDSIGGLVSCSIDNVPVGWGEPFFNSIESVISHLVFSIPAIKGIEFGSGFASARMRGSEHNDALMDAEGKTLTNHAGGINGGISNGNSIHFRVAVKPTSSIGKAQESLNTQTGQPEWFSIEGRHDACIALRVPVVLEAVSAIALADFSLQFRGSE